MSVYTSLVKELCCPLCGDTTVQIDEVRLSTGGPYKTVEVTLDVAGEMRESPGQVPKGPSSGPMADHRFALVGWCGDCAGAFALVFTSCSGSMIVESVELAGTPRESESAARSAQLESEAERRFWTALRDSPPPVLAGLVPQHQVGRYRLDFALPEQRIGIEIDGYAYHSSKDAFENDRLRQRALERLGWRIFRYSGSEACNDPAACVRDAAELVAKCEVES